MAFWYRWKLTHHNRKTAWHIVFGDRTRCGIDQVTMGKLLPDSVECMEEIPDSVCRRCIIGTSPKSLARVGLLPYKKYHPKG